MERLFVWDSYGYTTKKLMWTSYTETTYKHTKMYSEMMVQLSNESRFVRDPFSPDLNVNSIRGLYKWAGPPGQNARRPPDLSLIQITWTKCAMSSLNLITAQIQPPDWTKCKYCKRCYFRVTKFSRLAAQKHIRGLLNSRWADAHL